MSLSDYHIMGTGHKTSEDCNKVVAVKYCKGCGQVEPRYKHCHNWDCPECYFWNASDSAYDVQERLLGVQRAYSAVGKRTGRILQVILSVPPSEYEDFNLKNARRKVYRFAEMIGILGGACVFHSHRIKEELKAPLIEALKGTGLVGGLWAGAHADLLHLGSLEAYGVSGPHFHLLAYFPKIVMKSDVFHKLTGWTYKTIGVYQERNIFKTARYLLTHVALDGHSQAVTYFGIASYNKTSVETIKTVTLEACPKCGSEDYFLIRCGEHRYEQLSAGVQLINGRFQRVKPSDDELVRHARIYKKVKFFTVRTIQAQLPACAAVA